MFGKHVLIICSKEERIMKGTKFILFQEKLQYHILFGYSSMFLIICIFTAGTIFFFSKSKASEHVDSYKYYTSLEIKSGDTLWGIASQYGTDGYNNLQEYVEEVKSLNNLKGDTIHSGQFLIIPYYSYED